MIEKYYQFIKESLKKDEIIYLKDLYNKQPNRKINPILNELSDKLIGRWVKVDRLGENGDYEPFIKKYDEYFYVKDVRLRDQGNIYESIVLIIDPETIGWIRVNMDCRIRIKPIVRIFTKEDPYGEEEWEEEW